MTIFWHYRLDDKWNYTSIVSINVTAYLLYKISDRCFAHFTDCFLFGDAVKRAERFLFPLKYNVSAYQLVSVQNDGSYKTNLYTFTM